MNWWRRFNQKFNPIAAAVIVIVITLGVLAQCGSQADRARADRIDKPYITGRMCINGWEAVVVMNAPMYLYDKEQRLVACVVKP